MKIANAMPLIISHDLEKEIATAESLGCVVKHHFAGKEQYGAEYYVVATAEGNKVEFLEMDGLDKGFFGWQFNVEDFDAAVAEYKAKGFKELRNIRDTQASFFVLLTDEKGTKVSIVNHKKA